MCVESAPLRDDDAAFPPLDAAPHPRTALFEVLRACVDRVERRGFGLAPVGDEAPSHGVHDERGLLRSRTTDDGRVCAGCDVVPGHVAISVHPLIDAEGGVAVELLDLVRLILFILEISGKMRFGADCTHLKRECESAAHDDDNCQGYAPAWRTGGASPPLLARGCVRPGATNVIRLCVYTQSESKHTVLHHDAMYIYRTGGTRAAESDPSVERKREGGVDADGKSMTTNLQLSATSI